jgi:hypothetical protein
VDKVKLVFNIQLTNEKQFDLNFLKGNFMKYFILISILSMFSFCSSKTDKNKKGLLGLLYLFANSRNNSISQASSICAASSAEPTVDSLNSLTRIQVTPNQAASCVTQFNDPHQIYPPSASAKNILSIFYPGTGAVSSEYGLILQRGALRGYHVIGLNYPNPDSINVICNRSDAGGSFACFGDTREEILTGVDKSRFVSIDQNNSIEGRILALLKYLSVKRPADGWGNYFSDNQILWNKIYVGGHSQGSGHAGYQGKIRTVGRVSIYSGISDFSASQLSVPSWMSLAQLSLNGSYYGFIHDNDTIANYSGNANQVTDAWNNQFVMSGVLTNVNTGTPYGNSRKLFSTACAAQDQTTRHACPIINGFQTVWDYISYP